MAACALSVIACAALAAPTYDVSCLDCSLDTPLMPLGINQSGAVVATENCSGLGSFPPYMPPLDCSGGNGYVIDHGAVTRVPVPAGAPYSQAQAINNLGVVTGWANQGRDREPLGFAWDGVIFINLGDGLAREGDERLSRPTSINDSNHIVGSATINQLSIVPFFFKNGVMKKVPPLPGAVWDAGHEILRINARDHIVGTSTLNADDTLHAWINKKGATTMLDPVYDFSEAIGMNDADAVVGWTRRHINEPYLPAIWRNGKRKLLDTPPGMSGQANSINNLGWVVGDRCAGIDCKAFVFDGTAMFDLDTLLSASSAGWTLLQATAINDAGVIVGGGTFDGVFHGYMATPVNGADGR
jgi:uncharacterized membrane protein